MNNMHDLLADMHNISEIGNYAGVVRRAEHLLHDYR